MERETALNILESILFVASAPVPARDIHQVLGEFNEDEIRQMAQELNGRFEHHGIFVTEIAEGFQLRTKSEYADWVKKFHKLNHSTKLSQAALESLSIIAYRQPITRQEVEDIRGVDCSGVVKNLLDKGLIKSLGRKKVPGKPVTFGTTKKFLEYFGLVKLTDMPTLKDLPGDEAAVLQEALRFEAPAGENAGGDEAGEFEPSEEDYEAFDEESGDPVENENEGAENENR